MALIVRWHIDRTTERSAGKKQENYLTKNYLKSLRVEKTAQFVICQCHVMIMKSLIWDVVANTSVPAVLIVCLELSVPSATLMHLIVGKRYTDGYL